MNLAVERALAAAVAQRTGDRWRLSDLWPTREGLALAFDTEGGPLELRVVAAGQPAYRTVGPRAYQYRSGGASLAPAQRQLLDAALDALEAAFAAAALDPLDPRALTAPSDGAAFPSPRHRAHLAAPLALTDAQRAAYRADGHFLLRGALDREVLLAARPDVEVALQRAWPPDLPPPSRRPDAYSAAFVQVTNLGLDDPRVRALAHAPRLARLAADLMGVPAVRVFCEDWFVKEPEAALTPWHQDAVCYPFDAAASVTAWLPLQDTSPDMGLLRFALGSHLGPPVDIENICDASEALFTQVIAQRGPSVRHLPPLRLGDVSFHDGWTFHGATPNRSATPRVALALHFFANGARVKRPTTPTMQHLLASFGPGLSPGDPASSPAWPRVHPPAPAAPAPAAQAFHLRATLLPDGQAPVDLWVRDGRLTFDPVPGAPSLAPPGGFVCAGLVDAHAHVSWAHDADTPAHAAAYMNDMRALYAGSGVTLLRELGASSDAVLSLGDAPGLPRVHAAGTCVLRSDAFSFAATPPDRLRDAFLARAHAGARWVKVFADWTDDFGGKERPGFGADDEVTYPLPVLADAVAAVHALGVRVAAHAFTRAGAQVALEAGVDSLEHGWGLDEPLIDQMAADPTPGRRTAWVPLAGIAMSMWQKLRRDGDADRVAWVERSMQRLAHLIPYAHARGVPILAGTDWFPEVTVADEVDELIALGLSPDAAVGAASWTARAYLGEPGLTEGAPADLVLFRRDPRLDPSVLAAPDLILLAGQRVRPSTAGLRPHRLPWRRRHEQP